MDLGGSGNPHPFWRATVGRLEPRRHAGSRPPECGQRATAPPGLVVLTLGIPRTTSGKRAPRPDGSRPSPSGNFATRPRNGGADTGRDRRWSLRTRNWNGSGIGTSTFSACLLRPGKVAPGTFGNWTSAKIGNQWHGDYNLNYNTQQAYWASSATHYADFLPYARPHQMLSPMARWNAREMLACPAPTSRTCRSPPEPWPRMGKQEAHPGHEFGVHLHQQVAPASVPLICLKEERDVPRHFRVADKDVFFRSAHVEYLKLCRVRLQFLVGLPRCQIKPERGLPSILEHFFRIASSLRLKSRRFSLSFLRANPQ